jgi:hypothetical protein
MKLWKILLGLTTLLIAKPLHGAEAGSSLVQDAKTIATANGASWKSEVLDLQLKDGSHDKRILVMQFAPIAKDDESNPPNVKVKLALATVPSGPFNVNSSLGDGSFQNVHFKEKDGIRTITIVRALETIERPGKNTQRNFERSALTFAYELKGETLTLKGFPTGPTTWGPTGFTTGVREIGFKAAK